MRRRRIALNISLEARRSRLGDPGFSYVILTPSQPGSEKARLSLPHDGTRGSS